MENEFILRIFVAAILGGMIGLEREYRSKEAGFRRFGSSDGQSAQESALSGQSVSQDSAKQAVNQHFQ